MKLVEFLVGLLLLTSVFSILFAVYRRMARVAYEKLEDFNNSLDVYHTRSLIQELTAFGIPFEFSGRLSSNYEAVLEGLSNTKFNPFTKKYEYLTCRRL